MRLLAAVFQASVIAFVLAGCAPHPGPGNGSAESTTAAENMSQAQSAGAIVGTVSRGPVTPNQPMGHPGTAPVPDARIDVSTPEGNPVTSAQTDAQGNFRITLPPGNYRITLPSGRTRDLPATVAIAPGEERRLDITIDTGLY